MTTANQAQIRVKACQVKLFTVDGKQIIYRFGDPDEKREIMVAVSMEQNYDEIAVDHLLDSAMIFKSSPPEYTFTVKG